MNRIKRMLVVLCGTLFLVCAAFFAACGDEEEKKLYAVELNYDAAQGTVSVGAPQAGEKYAEGEQVTVTVTANAGFEIGTVSVNGTEVSLTEGKYTFAIVSDTTVSVTFTPKSEPEPKTYSVTVAQYDAAQGTVNVSAPQTGEKYAEGEQVTVTVTANAGFEIGTVSVNGTEVSLTEGKYTFAIVSDTTVSVTFTPKSEPEPKTYSVTVAQYDAAQGTVNVSAPQTGEKYAEGEQVTVTVTANAGYRVLSVSVNESPVFLTDNQYVFSVEEDTVIVVVFEEVAAKTYSVTVAQYDAAQGTVNVSAPQTGEKYAEGEQVTVTVTANAGFEIVSVSVNGTTVTLTEGKYTFAIVSDTTVAVVFKQSEVVAPVVFPEAFRGTWKQINAKISYTELRITEDELFLNETPYEVTETGEGGVSAYSFKAGAFTYTFGFMDSDGTLLCMHVGSNDWIMTKEGKIPSVPFPSEYCGTSWDNANFGRIVISADGKFVCDDKPYDVLSVVYDGETPATVYLMSNDKVFFVLTVGADTLKLKQLGGYMDYVFEKVAVIVLPEEFNGEWKELGGSNAITVSGGELSYNGTHYDVYESERGTGYLFTADVVYEFELSWDGYCLLLSTENAFTTYVADGVTLPDLSFGALGEAASYLGTSWTSAAGDRLTISEGGEVLWGTEKVRFLTLETNTSDGVREVIGTAIAQNRWTEFTFAPGRAVFNFAGEEVYFTPGDAPEPPVEEIEFPPSYLGTWERIGSGTSATIVITQDSFEIDDTEYAVTKTAEGYSFVYANGGSGVSCTLALTEDELILYVCGGGSYVCFRNTLGVPSAGDLPVKYCGTVWKGTGYDLTFSQEGALEIGGASAEILTFAYAGSAFDPDMTTLTSLTAVSDALGWFKLTFAGKTVTLAPLGGNTSVFTLEEEVVPSDPTTLPQTYFGEWVILDGSYNGGDTVTIDANGLHSNNETLPFYTENGEYYTLFEKEKYTIKLMTDGNVLAIYNGEETLFFKKAGLDPSVFAPPAYCNTKWSCPGQPNLTIGEDGDIFPGEGVITLLTLSNDLRGTAIYDFTSWCTIVLTTEQITIEIFNGATIVYTPGVQEETYAVTFDTGYQGEWHETGKEDGHTIGIGKHELFFDGVEAEVSGDAENGYTFKADGAEYTIALTEDGWVLWYLNAAHEYVFFEQDFMPSAKAPAEYFGTTWKDGSGNTLVFDEKGNATWNGEAVTFLSLRGEMESAGFSVRLKTIEEGSLLCGGVWYSIVGTATTLEFVALDGTGTTFLKQA